MCWRALVDRLVQTRRRGRRAIVQLQRRLLPMRQQSRYFLPAAERLLPAAALARRQQPNTVSWTS
jgi:hypothetical protein